MNLKNIAALLALLCAGIQPSYAVEPTIKALTFKHPDGRPAPAEIYIDGEITPALPRQLAAALAGNNIERGTIYLNSVGGDLQAGLELGEFIRSAGFNTAVGKRGGSYGKAQAGACQSACLMTFAGGVYRFADDRAFFGIHRAYANTVGTQDLALGQILSAAITGYLIRMGVDPSLFERMVAAGARPQKLSVGEASALKLVNNGVLPAKWEIVGRAGKVFLQGEQRTWNGNGMIRAHCSQSKGLTMTALYDAEHNSSKIVSEVKHLSLRIDGRFIGVSASAVIRQTRLQDGYITTEFAVPQNLALELGRSRSIGFAWLPAETSIFYGFDLPVPTPEVVSSFVQHCSEI